MEYPLQPIVITPEQIIAAAQKIANNSEDAWQYTSEEFLLAVRHFLEKTINDIVYDADWHARKEGFDGGYHGAFSVEFANELVMPKAPEWTLLDFPPEHNDKNLYATAEQMYGGNGIEDNPGLYDDGDDDPTYIGSTTWKGWKVDLYSEDND